MKRINIIYWILTSLFALAMLFSAVPDIMVVPDAVKIFKALNMPAYLIQFLGVAKLFGVIAVLIPGFPRLKEWAYAGLMIDVLGATYCIVSSFGYAVINWAPMLIFIGLGFASYFAYHRRLKMLASKRSTGRDGILHQGRYQNVGTATSAIAS